MQTESTRVAIDSLKNEVSHCNLMIEKHQYEMDDRNCINKKYHQTFIDKYQKEVGILEARIQLIDKG